MLVNLVTRIIKLPCKKTINQLKFISQVCNSYSLTDLSTEVLKLLQSEEQSKVNRNINTIEEKVAIIKELTTKSIYKDQRCKNINLLINTVDDVLKTPDKMDLNIWNEIYKSYVSYNLSEKASEILKLAEEIVTPDVFGDLMYKFIFSLLQLGKKETLSLISRLLDKYPLKSISLLESINDIALLSENAARYLINFLMHLLFA